jgi:hypothetical protein
VLKYVVDQWWFASDHTANTATWTVFQAATAAYPGLTEHLGIRAPTAWSVSNANDDVTVCQRIEGQRWAKLGWGTSNALSISIGFWIYATIAGTCALNIRNAANNRSYVTPISITAALTWQYKTVTVPGDITGTWLTDTNVGAILSFCLGAGSAYITPNTNVWQAGLWLAQTGITNFFATNNNEVYITGVSLIPGNTPVPLEQSAAIRRDPAEELRLCQRYYQKITFTSGQYIATLQAVSATQATGLFWSHSEMRAPSVSLGPTIAQFSLQPAAGGGSALSNVSGMNSTAVMTYGSAIVASGLVAGNATELYANTVGAFFQANARL